LHAALTAEQAALLDFVALLECEQGMLVENSGDQLLELARQKTSAALGLNRLAQECRILLQEHIPQSGAGSIQAWLGAHSPEALAIWLKILNIAKRSQQLNRANGELIQMKLRHNQLSLAILSNAANKASLYGPDGQPDFATVAGRSLGNG
jgi:flagella synthesis protein FlgN